MSENLSVNSQTPVVSVSGITPFRPEVSSVSAIASLASRVDSVGAQVPFAPLVASVAAETPFPQEVSSLQTESLFADPVVGSVAAQMIFPHSVESVSATTSFPNLPKPDLLLKILMLIHTIGVFIYQNSGRGTRDIQTAWKELTRTPDEVGERGYSPSFERLLMGTWRLAPPGARIPFIHLLYGRVHGLYGQDPYREELQKKVHPLIDAH